MVELGTITCGSKEVVELINGRNNFHEVGRALKLKVACGILEMLQEEQGSEVEKGGISQV